MTVDTFDPQQFDPSQSHGRIDDAMISRVLRAGYELTHTPDEISLDPDEVAALSPMVTHRGWSDAAEAMAVADIVALIRLFTLGEMMFSSWRAGAKSAVVPLVRVLKRRGEINPELISWIKATTDNRFLPHGDLMDRL